MSVELAMTKRAARAGEMGLFVESEVFAEEWSSIKIGSECKAVLTVPATLKYLKFFWALIGKVYDNTDSLFLDKEDCKERILLEARHAKIIIDNLRDKTEIKAKSVANLSGDAWLRLLRRCVYVVETKYLPGMDHNALKAEIEAMIGVDAAPPPEKPKERAKPDRAPKAQPAPETHPEPSVGQETPSIEHGEAAAKPKRMEPPQNEAEYIIASRQWLARQTDAGAARAYFESEAQIALRAACKVSVGSRKMLLRELAMKFEEKVHDQTKA